MPGESDKGTVLVEFRFRSMLCDIEPEILARMVRQSWRNNLRSGVTGEMRVEGHRVEQVIEGSIDVVLPMAARILADRRHTSIETTVLGPLEARRFGDWRVHGMPPEATIPVEADGTVALFPTAVRGEGRIAARRTA